MAQTSQAEVRTVTLREAEKSIRRAMRRKRPVFVWGPPGIGKSDLMEQITASFEKGWLIDLRMALMEPTDIRGIPYYNQAENTMSWAHPVDLPAHQELHLQKQYRHGDCPRQKQNSGEFYLRDIFGNCKLTVRMKTGLQDVFHYHPSP